MQGPHLGGQTVRKALLARYELIFQGPATVVHLELLVSSDLLADDCFYFDFSAYESHWVVRLYNIKD
jgi:hypothetical protein